MRMQLNGLVESLKAEWLCVYNTVSRSTGVGMGDNGGYAETKSLVYSTVDEMMNFVRKVDIKDVRVYRVGRELDDTEIKLVKELTETDN